MRTACRAWLLPTIYQIEKPATLNTRTYILVQKRCAVRGGQSRKANDSCLAPTDTELDRSQPARRIRPSWLTESITSPGEHVLCEPRMSATATPYQGTSWHDRLLNRSFAFVHIWSHFVQARRIYCAADLPRGQGRRRGHSPRRGRRSSRASSSARRATAA